jgi:hypothetical protein
MIPQESPHRLLPARNSAPKSRLLDSLICRGGAVQNRSLCEIWHSFGFSGDCLHSSALALGTVSPDSNYGQF